MTRLFGRRILLPEDAWLKTTLLPRLPRGGGRGAESPFTKLLCEPRNGKGKGGGNSDELSGLAVAVSGNKSVFFVSSTVCRV